MREHRRTLRVRSTLLDEDLEDSVPRKYSHLDGASILVSLLSTLIYLCTTGAGRPIKHAHAEEQEQEKAGKFLAK